VDAEKKDKRQQVNNAKTNVYRQHDCPAAQINILRRTVDQQVAFCKKAFGDGGHYCYDIFVKIAVVSAGNILVSSNLSGIEFFDRLRGGSVLDI